jgi:hypothetical protein
MPQGVFSKLLGTIASFFQVGDSSGPGLNANGAALEARNAANSAYAIFRSGGPPVGDNDVANKSYVDQLANKPVPVSVQFNGGVALPANSGAEKWYVVTTTGVNASIGQLLWDDGSGVGTVQVIPAATGNTLVTTAAFAGGAITFVANHVYTWTGAAWVDVSSAAAPAGVTFMIRIPIGTAAATSSASNIPSGAVIYDAKFVVTTPYSVGATVQMGVAGTVGAFMGVNDNNPGAAANTAFQVMQDTLYGGAATPLLVSVGGAPGAGAGIAVLLFSTPLS